MMKKNILPAKHFENIGMGRKGGIAPRLKRPVLQIGKSIICDQRHEMRHGERAVRFVNVGLGQVEKFEQ